MSQTDRQTDSQPKSMLWSVTAYNDDILILKDKDTYPSYVRRVLGQDEICPETQRPHFQGLIQLTTQQRRSALKKWLPTAHLEICRDKNKLKNYVQKDATRDPEGDQIDNEGRISYIPFDKLCELLADTFLDIEEEWKDLLERLTTKELKDLYKHQFIFIVRHLILNGYSRQASAFADNRLKAFWIDTGSCWIDLRRTAREEAEEAKASEARELL